MLVIVQYLIYMELLIVVINDFVIVDYLFDNSNCIIIYIGGVVCWENCFCVGEVVVIMLCSLMIDQVFIFVLLWSVWGIFMLVEDKVMVKWVIVSVSCQ